MVTASHQAEGGEGVAERARNMLAARLSRSVESCIPKTIGGPVGAIHTVSERWAACIMISEKKKSV